jgi:hypothetical protein
MCEEDKHAYVSAVGNPTGRRRYKKPKHREEDFKANFFGTEFINVLSLYDRNALEEIHSELSVLSFADLFQIFPVNSSSISRPPNISCDLSCIVL